MPPASSSSSSSSSSTRRRISRIGSWVRRKISPNSEQPYDHAAEADDGTKPGASAATGAESSEPWSNKYSEALPSHPGPSQHVMSTEECSTDDLLDSLLSYPWIGLYNLRFLSPEDYASDPDMATLIKPNPPDPNVSAMETQLELLHLGDIDPNLFTNRQPQWHPVGARGIYGGSVIAQCLVAAQKTVPDNFNIHSMHCYFVLAGNAQIPVIYHVERVRDGKSFCTRTVQARQRGKAIFTTTMSFVREGAGGKKLVEHAAEMRNVPPPVDDRHLMHFPQGLEGPIQSQRIDILNNDSDKPQDKKTRNWIKVIGKISEGGGHQAHLSALAFMSDSFFIGTVSRVHKLWRFTIPSKGSQPTDEKNKGAVPQELIAKLQKMDDAQLRRLPGMDEDVIKALRQLKDPGDVQKVIDSRPQIGMMVSLDHTIYFHDPRGFRADEWLYQEMETPWAGDGRGVVFQKVFTREGKLIATCVQEGLVRLKQDSESKL